MSLDIILLVFLFKSSIIIFWLSSISVHSSILLSFDFFRGAPKQQKFGDGVDDVFENFFIDCRKFLKNLCKSQEGKCRLGAPSTSAPVQHLRHLQHLQHLSSYFRVFSGLCGKIWCIMPDFFKMLSTIFLITVKP